MYDSHLDLKNRGGDREMEEKEGGDQAWEGTSARHKVSPIVVIEGGSVSSISA